MQRQIVFCASFSANLDYDTERGTCFPRCTMPCPVLVLIKTFELAAVDACNTAELGWSCAHLAGRPRCGQSVAVTVVLQGSSVLTETGFLTTSVTRFRMGDPRLCRPSSLWLTNILGRDSYVVAGAFSTLLHKSDHSTLHVVVGIAVNQSEERREPAECTGHRTKRIGSGVQKTHVAQLNRSFLEGKACHFYRHCGLVTLSAQLKLPLVRCKLTSRSSSVLVDRLSLNTICVRTSSKTRFPSQ